MRTLSFLSLEIYNKLQKSYPNLTELRKEVRKHILKEIAQWTVKELEKDRNYFFKPNEFSGDKNSAPFEIVLRLGEGCLTDAQFSHQLSGSFCQTAVMCWAVYQH